MNENNNITSLMVVNEENNGLTPEEKFVCQAFHELKINKEIIDIDQCSDIYRRLAATGDHFKDAVSMAKIMRILLSKSKIKSDNAILEIDNRVKTTRDELSTFDIQSDEASARPAGQQPESTNEDEILFAVLIHDIGKSGPLNSSVRAKKLLKVLFPAESVKEVTPVMTIEEYLKTPKISQGLQSINMTAEEAKRVIELELDGMEAVDQKGEKTGKPDTILNFFRRHAKWTEDILCQLAYTDTHSLINTKLINIVANHHALDGCNPYDDTVFDSANGLPWQTRVFEFFEKQSNLKKNNETWIDILTLIDKYQAFRQRSNKNHQESIAILDKIIDKNPFLSPADKLVYKKHLNLLDSCQNEIAQVLIE